MSQFPGLVTGARTRKVEQRERGLKGIGSLVWMSAGRLTVVSPYAHPARGLGLTDSCPPADGQVLEVDIDETRRSAG